MQLICPTRQANSFFQKDWTGFRRTCLSGKSACQVAAQLRRSDARGRHHHVGQDGLITASLLPRAMRRRHMN
jgi:hypothetical protein